jgi:hypothetical protein
MAFAYHPQSFWRSGLWIFERKTWESVPKVHWGDRYSLNCRLWKVSNDQVLTVHAQMLPEVISRLTNLFVIWSQ